MKKTFLTLFLLGVFFCEAQQILPLTTRSNEIPLNSYIKDTENQLPDFEGTWKGNWNDKTLTIIIE